MIFIADLNHDLNRFKSLNQLNPAVQLYSSWQTWYCEDVFVA